MKEPHRKNNTASDKRGFLSLILKTDSLPMRIAMLSLIIILVIGIFVAIFVPSARGSASDRITAVPLTPIQPMDRISDSVASLESPALGSGYEQIDGELLGSGSHKINRDEDLYHTLKEGETLSEIAYLYTIDIQKLAAYNNIPNIHSVRAGADIRIPSYENEKKITLRSQYETSAASRSGGQTSAAAATSALPQLHIAVQKEYDGQAVHATFFIDRMETNISAFTDFEWDLDYGIKGYGQQIKYTFSQPRTHKVFLTARDNRDRKIISDVIYIHVPHPGTYMDSSITYLTLDRPDQHLILEGQIVDVYGYAYVDQGFDFLGTNELGQFVYTTKRTGFFTFTMETEEYRKKINLFVSPVPSYHVESTALNWYRTQFQTGTLGNCGPASVSMAIACTTGKYVPVIDIRQKIGYRGDGGTNFQELRRVLTENGVTSNQMSIHGTEDIFKVLDRGNLVLALFQTGGVEMVAGDPGENLFGKYYPDSVGHYVIIKGYSLDKKYFIVQDPIPSDWGTNAFRHLDGISMMGRNRYYSTHNLFRSLRVPVIIEVVM